MPLELVSVDRVGSVGTANPNVRQFCVDAHTVEEIPRAVQFFTIKPLQASACERAKEVGRYVWIGWKDSRYRMKDIVTVQIDDTKFDASNPPKEQVIR